MQVDVLLCVFIRFIVIYVFMLLCAYRYSINIIQTVLCNHILLKMLPCILFLWFRILELHWVLLSASGLNM